MSAKRILILTNRVPYPLNDGGNLAMNAVIEGYHKAGWQVYLLAMNTTKHYLPGDTISKIYQNIHRFETVSVDNRLTVSGTLKNYLFSKEPNHASRFRNKAFAEKLEAILHSFDPHVIQVESVFLAGYMPLIKTESKAVTVLRVHNVEYRIWRRLARETEGLLKTVYLNNLAKRIKAFEKHAWQQFDVLLPITDVDAEVLKRNKATGKLIVIPFGIDIKKIKPSSGREDWVGYHIGAMDWIPNAEGINWFLKKAWPYLHKIAPDFKFYFAGRNMPAEFNDIDLPGVYCAGEVPDADAFIADKKILIVPLRSGSGIRVKILEAMAAGKIVISTDVGMQGIEALPGTHYMSANELKDFGKAVNWCRMHRQEAEVLGSNAVELIKAKYDNALIMSHLIDELNNISLPRK